MSSTERAQLSDCPQFCVLLHSRTVWPGPSPTASWRTFCHLQNDSDALDDARLPSSLRTPGSCIECPGHAQILDARRRHPKWGPREAPSAWCSLHFQSISFSKMPFAGSHIFPTGPIDGCGQECPVQLRVHLSLPSKRSQARSVCELCVFRDCCGRTSGILNTCTSASWAFPLPSLGPRPHLPFASEMQLLGPYRGEPSGQDSALFGLPPLSAAPM